MELVTYKNWGIISHDQHRTKAVFEFGLPIMSGLEIKISSRWEPIMPLPWSFEKFWQAFHKGEILIQRG